MVAYAMIMAFVSITCVVALTGISSSVAGLRGWQLFSVLMDPIT